MILMKMISMMTQPRKDAIDTMLFCCILYWLGHHALSSSLKSSKYSSSLMIDLSFSALFLVEFFLFFKF